MYTSAIQISKESNLNFCSFLASSNFDLIFDRNNKWGCSSFSSSVLSLFLKKSFQMFGRIFSSTQRDLFQTEIGFRKLGRILMDRFFNENMEYSGALFVNNKKIEMLV